MGQDVLSILLAASSPEQYRQIESLLTGNPGHSYRITWEKSSTAARESLRQNQWDVCLLFQDLHPQTGLELAAEYSRQAGDVPVILLAPTVEPALEAEARAAGAADCLAVEWLSPPVLDRAIRYAVELVQTRREGKILQAEARRMQDITDALQEIALALNSAPTLEDLLNLILVSVRRLIPHDTADIMLVEDGTVQVVKSLGYREHGYPPTQGMRFQLADFPTLHRMIKTGQPVIISDTQTSPDWIDIEQTRWVRSYAGAPIHRQGQVIGFLNLASAQPNFFTPEQTHELLLFAQQAGIALQNAHLLKAEREQRHIFETLREVNLSLGATLDLNTVLDRLLEHAGQLVPYDSANVMLKEGDEVRIVRGRGYEKFGPETEKAVKNLRFNIRTTANLEHIIQTGKPAIVKDTATYPNWVRVEATSYIRSWIGIPLSVKGEVIGFFALDKAEPNFYQPHHVDRLMLLAPQAALAVANARLYEAEARRRREAEILHRVTVALASDLDLYTALDRLLQHLRSVVHFDRASIFMQEQSGDLRIMAAYGFPNADELVGRVFSRQGEQLFAEIDRTRQPLILEDARSDPRFLGWGGARQTRGWLGVPIIARDRIIGYIACDNHTPAAYTPEDAYLVQTLANQAGIVIENARLFQETRQNVAALNAVHEASLSLTSTLDLATVLDTILENALRLIPQSNNANIFLYQDDQLIFGAARDWQGPKTAPFAPPRPHGLTYTVAREGRMVVVSDIQEHPLFRDPPPEWQGSIVGLPLTIGQRVVGVMNIASESPRRWSEAELRILELLAEQAAIAIENARLFTAEHTARRQAEALREESARQLALIKRLYELSADFVSATSVEQAARLVIQKIVQASRAHSAVINLLDDEGRFERAFGPTTEPAARPDGTTMTIYRTGKPLIVSDARREKVNLPPYLIQAGIRATIGLPLKAGDRIIGVLFVRYAEPHFFSRQEIEMLFIFANQAAIAIQNARLHEQVQQHAAELEKRVQERTFELQVLYELSQALGHTTRQSDVLRLVLLHMSRVMHYDLAAFLLVADHTARFVVQSQYPISPSLVQEIQEIMLYTLEKLGGPAVSKAVTQHTVPHPTDRNGDLLDSLGSIAQVELVIDGTPCGVLLIGQRASGQMSRELPRLLRVAADQASESLRRVQSLVAEEYRRLENLVANLPNGLVLLDADRQIVMTNPLGQEMLTLVGQTTTLNQLTHLDRYTIDDILSQSHEAPIELTISTNPERIIQITAHPITLDPEAKGVLLMFRDVTQERHIQRQIQQQEQLAAVGQLAAGIAHDFNNILTSIIGYAELLQMDRSLTPSVRHDLERITSQSQRAAHLIRQILDFSRQSISEKRPLNLVPLMKETVKLLERTIPENIHIQLEIVPSRREYTVRADLPQLQQVLTNLAVNARDAMPDGGKLSFRLGWYDLAKDDAPPCPEMKPGRWVSIRVSDTGVGIAPEHLPHIFEPFFTTKAVGKGTGLGLAQAYGIITQHNGFILADSRLGQGTTFTIYLPYYPEKQVQPLSSGAGAGQIAGQNELILLVEDNPTVLDITRAMLTHLGYRVLTAKNGAEAVELFQIHGDDIALVLTDVTMPEMGGLELAQTISARQAGVKIIAVSGYPMDASRDVDRWRQVGIVEWLQKPLNLQTLGQALRRALAGEGQAAAND